MEPPPEGTPPTIREEPIGSPPPPELLYTWPEPSVKQLLEYSLFSQDGKALKMKDIGDILRKACMEAAYPQPSYRLIPGGFALVNAIEKIDKNGVIDPDRWDTSGQNWTRPGFLGWLEKIFLSQTGYYRMVVFMVSTEGDSLETELRDLTVEEAEDLYYGGQDMLPYELGATEIQPETLYSSAWIYFFIQSNEEDPAIIIRSVRISGEDHLRKAGLWEALYGQ